MMAEPIAPLWFMGIRGEAGGKAGQYSELTLDVDPGKHLRLRQRGVRAMPRKSRNLNDLPCF